MITNNTKILWIIIIFLAVLNMATIGTIIYNNRQVKAEDENIVFEPDAQPVNGMYFKQTLGFDNHQMEVFRQSSRTFRQNANQIIGSINRSKEELFIELQTEQPDTARLQEISKEIGLLHAELKEVTVTFYLELNSVCNPEQKNKLKAVFVPLFRETPLQGGHGGNNGRGHGRRNRNI